jgi:hypothetical protein
MNISAKDKSTGKENKITIKSDSGLSKEEIERMVVEAEQNADADKKTRELIDTRNQAEATVHEIEKDLEEFKDQLTPEQVEEIQAAITAVEIAKQGDDADKIKAINGVGHKITLSNGEFFDCTYYSHNARIRHAPVVRITVIHGRVAVDYLNDSFQLSAGEAKLFYSIMSPVIRCFESAEIEVKVFDEIFS